MDDVMLRCIKRQVMWHDVALGASERLQVMNMIQSDIKESVGSA